MQDYIPIDRSLLVAKQGKKFLETNYLSLKEKVLERCKRFIQLPAYKYAGILYPHEAIEILALSRTDKWIHGKPDEIIEKVLTQWIASKIEDPHEFCIRLFGAIKELDCLDGTYLRLNFDILAQPIASSIRIVTRAGSVHKEVKTQSRPWSKAKRGRMRYFLINDGKFIGNLDEIYRGLEKIHSQYDLEQSLLAWMAYLIIRSLSEDKQLRLTGNQLMIEADK